MSASDSGYEADATWVARRSQGSARAAAAEAEAYFADNSDTSGRRGGAAACETTDSGVLGDTSATAFSEAVRAARLNRKRPRSPVRTERLKAVRATEDGRSYGTSARDGAQRSAWEQPTAHCGQGLPRAFLSPGWARSAPLSATSLAPAVPTGLHALAGASRQGPAAGSLAALPGWSMGWGASSEGRQPGARPGRELVAAGGDTRPGGRADAPPLARAARAAAVAAAASSRRPAVATGRRARPAPPPRLGQGPHAAARARLRHLMRGGGHAAQDASSPGSAGLASASGWDADEEDADDVSMSPRTDEDDDVSYEADEEDKDSGADTAAEPFRPECVPERADRAQGYEPSDEEDETDDDDDHDDDDADDDGDDDGGDR